MDANSDAQMISVQDDQNAMEIDGEREMRSEFDCDNASNKKNGTKSEDLNVLASSSVIMQAISISLHPLVILNISEHWTRIRAQSSPGASIKVIGAIIGKQKGRNIEIMNSFELKFDIINDISTIDIDFFRSKEQQFKQVFAEMEFLGWYTNGNDIPDITDRHFHKQMLELNENCLFLKLNPLGCQNGLSIKIYESIFDLVDHVSKMLFVEVPYTLQTEEAERIVLDHMVRTTSASSNGDNINSAVTEHLRVQYSAVKMLRDRIKLILEFVKDIKNKNIEANREILREILNLCHRLPIISSDTFDEDFYIQCNDVALVTYLGTLTKCLNLINQYANKFNILHDRSGNSRRLRLY
ncbi:Cuticle protein [Sarcoptes scabiei]|nr:COP9 signalosome complex subunit 6-like protein [Sarcoptes scabiei]UXI16043.1 Cuticle protein [Sarcoptes scabiei]